MKGVDYNAVINLDPTLSPVRVCQFTARQNPCINVSFERHRAKFGKWLRNVHKKNKYNQTKSFLHICNTVVLHLAYLSLYIQEDQKRALFFSYLFMLMRYFFALLISIWKSVTFFYVRYHIKIKQISALFLLLLCSPLTQTWKLISD